MPVLVNEIPLNGSPEPGSVLASTAKPIVRVDGEILASSGAEPVSLRTEDAVHGLERCQLTLAGAAAEPLRWYDPLLNALASLLRPGGGAARRLRGPAGIGGPVAIFDRSALDFGAELSVAFPSGDGEVVVFDGVITGLEGRFRADRAETLTVHAESRLIDLAMSQSTRNFEDDSVTGIVERIATFHSMETEVDLEDDVYRRYVAQLNQSDLDFLRQLAQFVDADIWMAGDALHVQSRRLRDPNPIDLVLGSSLGRFDALADLREQRTELTVGGEDVAAGNWLRVAANPGPVSGEL
ncbi:MAG: contractile injection system protein, VgrG/Pvc8 family, partial [Alphaproteobacteria bacterium]|nr:contractile injection system protein, VgrG/Pvc8 family [Alphaproteobacteria bacterium]